MAEWFNAAVLKTEGCDEHSVGSNPTASVKMFSSSMGEQSTVNALVVGSSPT